MERSDMTAQENTTISAEVKEMLDVAFNVSAGMKKREDAMTHLLVLASEEAGAEEIFKQGGISKIAQLVEGKEEAEEDDEVICIAIRIVGKLCENNISRTEAVMKYSYNGKIGDNGMELCLEMINSDSRERVNYASLYCLQNVLNTCSGMNDEPDSEPDEALCKLHKEKIDTILKWLLNNITNERITSGLARDALIEFITRNIHYTALNWAKQLVELDKGLHNLMEVASQLEDGIYKSSIDITCYTQSITNECLTKIYENMYSANDKKKFLDAITQFIENEFLKTTEQFGNEIREESKMRIVVAMTTLTFDPFDVATQIMTKEGFVKKIENFLETDNILLQKLICEFTIAAVKNFVVDNNWLISGHSTIDGYLKILRKLLYSSKDDSILVRVFVGFCYMEKFSKLPRLLCYGSVIPLLFHTEGTIKWLKIFKRCLIDRRAERDMRNWAVVGLSYLTFDTKVKNELIESAQAVKAMIKFSKATNLWAFEQKSLVILLVNLCSAYGEEAIIPETAQFAKYMLVENYLLVKDSFGSKRRRVLTEAGVTRGLVSLAKTAKCEECEELIAHVFNVISCQQNLRKIVVEQGGTKTLLSLALDGTDKGKKHALQALVHLALTIHPEIAFPGQMIMEVVRLIINLLNSSESSVNEKCEILTALYNLASVNDSIREHIFNEIGIENFDKYIDSNYDMFKLRSAQLLDNLTLCNGVANNDVFRTSNPANYDKQTIIKRLWYILNEDTDKVSYHATAGHIVRFTAAYPALCKNILSNATTYFHNLFRDKIFMESVKNFETLPAFLHFLLVNSNEDLQYRGIKIALNMMKNIKKVDAKLMEIGKIKEQLRVLSENDNMKNKEIKELASLALEAAAEWDEKHRKKRRNVAKH